MDIETTVRNLRKAPSIAAVTEAKAATFAVTEIERLKSIRAVHESLVATQGTFKERKKILTDHEKTLLAKIEVATAQHTLRVDKMEQLKRRHEDIKKQYRSVCETLRHRLRAAEAERTQREEIWTLFNRAAELIKGVGVTENTKEAELMQTIVLGHETRIIAIQDKLHKLRIALE
jgi:hypothetical protein